MFYGAMAIAALIVELIFNGFALVPPERKARVVEASITWNYTTWLAPWRVFMQPIRHSGYVAVGPHQAGNNAVGDGVADLDHDDRYRACRGFCRPHGGGCVGNDQLDRQLEHLAQQRGIAFVIALAPAISDVNRLAVDVPVGRERADELAVDRARRHAENADLTQSRRHCLLGGRHSCVSRGPSSGAAKPENLHWPVDVFQPLFAAVFELLRDAARDVLVNARRNAQPARRASASSRAAMLTPSP